MKLEALVLSASLLFTAQQDIGIGKNVVSHIKTPAQKVIYDYSKEKVTYRNLQHIIQATQKINVSVKAYFKGGTAVKSGHGSATVIGYHKNHVYLLTCAHLFSNPVGDSAIKLEEVFVMNYKNYDHKLEKVAISYEKDIALLRTQKEISYEGRIVNKSARAEELQVGQVVYAVGFPHGFGKNLTDGIITNLQAQGVPEWNNLLLSNVVINPGNSGGGLYVFKNGKPKLAGMSQMIFPVVRGVYGYVHIKTIKEFLGSVGYGRILK